ncbi:MAG: winged helix DNA-binding domain-containing protein, partial [Candidatus Promineifilaceae bacterium]|nr:winged helix DNA-binding domain-containing protein [Candidatus Promineifilaceae bacterium]
MGSMLLDIARRRLRNQQIGRERFDQPDQVPAWLGAMQAQDYAGVKWAIGLRCQTASDTNVEQAIADREIIRTWLMRGTLQIVAAEDVRWMVVLLGPRLIKQSARRRRELGLDDTLLARSSEVLSTVLHGRRQLTRTAVLQALEQQGISTVGQRGYHILRHAGLQGHICFGSMQNKEQTFVLLEEWAPQGQKKEREEALAELAQRYFTSHGPATLEDFVWWSGLTKAD